jgi:hypothetical protein
VDKTDLDNDAEADKTSKPAEIFEPLPRPEGDDSADLASEGTVDSVSHDANNRVDSVDGAPDPDENDSDHVAADSAVEPALEEAMDNVDRDASTKQAPTQQLNQRSDTAD